MLKLSWRCATFCAAVVVFGAFAAAEDRDGTEPAAGDPVDVRPLEVSDIETFPVVVDHLIEVTVHGLPRRLRDEYVVGVTLTNVGDVAVPGPLLLVAISTGVDGLETAPGDGVLADGADYVEVLPETATLQAGASTRRALVRLTTPLDERTGRPRLPSREELRRFSPRWSVRRDAPSPMSSWELNREELQRFSEKAYNYAELKRAMQVQTRWTPRLMQHEEVFGTGIGEGPKGGLVLQVFAPRAGVSKELPSSVDGFPVDVITMSRIDAGPIEPRPGADAEGRLIPVPESESLADAQNSSQTGPTQRVRPCGIGSSTSNLQDQCLSGTLGFVGRNSAGQKFLVSNWHVWADLAGAIGDDVLQPSRGDNACLLLSSDSIGQVTDKEEILFNGSANRIDLAVASMSTVAGQDAVSGSTPADGYGSPGSSPRSVLVGDTVRKYGRTTRQTSGKVFSVNSTVTVNYGGGRVALFTGQIGIRDAGGPFCRPGDSGSLVVDSHNNPVGLLFAGGGGTTFANPIREVLSRTGLTVVGATPPPDPAPTPGGGTASVGDRVFFDANGNGRADANELGVQNVSVTLYSAGGDGRFGGTDDRRLAMVRTNAAGRYRFSNLSAGAYYLRFGLIAGYQFTKQDAGSDAVDSDADPAGYTNVFVLTDGQTDLTRDAGLVSTAVRGNGGGNGNGRDGGVAPPPDNDQGRNGRGGRTGGRSPAPPPPGGGDHDNGGRDGSGGRSPSTPESPGGGEGGDSGSGGGERRGGRRGGRG